MNTADIACLMLDAETMTHNEAALALAEAGLPVFPCQTAGKTPLTPHGYHDATTNLAQVRAWWAAWPKANIGLPTGPACGLDVVDIDVRHTGDGRDAFTKASGLAGADMWGFQVSTPSGGQHLYYPAAPGPQTSWACGRSHVDFRGAGGYIIVPPSKIRTPGGRAARYQVTAIRPGEANPVDATKLRGLIDPAWARRQTAAPSGNRASGADLSRLAGWVANLPEGERNQGLYWAARRMAETGHDAAGTLSLLETPASRAGLPLPEIRATIASAHRQPPPTPTTTPATSLYIGPAASPSCEAVTL